MLLLIKNLLFTLLVPGSVAVYLPWLLARPIAPPGVAAVALAALLFLVAGAIYLWCLWDFATFGRGTPAPIDAPKRLVVRGLYRVSRNPMYLGVLTAIAGWAALSRDPDLVLYLAGVATVFQLMVVLYEEPTLERAFGAEYTAYRARVRRWLGRRRV